MAAGAGCDVEREAARQQVEHLDDRRLRRSRPGAGAMAAFPIAALLRLASICVAHSTRARVSTSIRRAPAARSTRAHSSAVAPVVITSSTSNTRRPATRAGRRTAKASRTLRRALGVVVRGLRRGRAHARERGDVERAIEPPRECGAQQRGLVEAAPSKARAMERHRDDDVVSHRLPTPARRRGTPPARAPATDRGRTCAGAAAPRQRSIRRSPVPSATVVQNGSA